MSFRGRRDLLLLRLVVECLSYIFVRTKVLTNSCFGASFCYIVEYRFIFKGWGFVFYMDENYVVDMSVFDYSAPGSLDKMTEIVYAVGGVPDFSRVDEKGIASLVEDGVFADRFLN
jgi:hypothetical protein